MKSGDSLKVHKDSTKVQLSKQLPSKALVAATPADIKPYTSTYFPTLLAVDVDHGVYSIVEEAASSILPSNIMQKAVLDNSTEAINFHFFNYKGVDFVPLSGNEDIVTQVGVDSLKKHISALDSTLIAEKDSIDIRPAIDSLPNISFAKESFKISDLDSSLLSRFGLQEYISRDSYILLESHPELVYGKSSLKTQITVPAKVGEAIPRETQNLGFVSFAFLTIGIIFFVVSLKFQFKHVVSIFKSLISFHEAHKTYQSRSLGFKRFETYSALFYLLTVTVFTVLIAQKFAGSFIRDLGIFLAYLLFLGSITVLFFLKKLVMSVVANISRRKDLFDELKFSHQIFCTAIALSLFPLQVIASYSDFSVASIFIYTSIYLVIILLILYSVRSLRLFLSYRVSFFFWFLYFCTLEMLPVAVGLYLLE